MNGPRGTHAGASGPAVDSLDGAEPQIPAPFPRNPLHRRHGSEAIAASIADRRVGAPPDHAVDHHGVPLPAAVANGSANLWGTPLRFVEPESEHSCASAAEGFALAGGRVTNFTAGQGLILMKEVLYAIAGKRLPAVFHVGARALTSQALNIHCGHDDVMGVADCGWGIVFARNARRPPI